MCGIAGILNTKKDIRKTTLSLNLSIKQRGPDDSGYYYWFNNVKIVYHRN